MKKYQWSAEVAPRDARELQGSRGENQMNCFFCWGQQNDIYIIICVYIYISSQKLHPPTPRTSIAPETRPLENDIPIGNHHFQGPF